MEPNLDTFYWLNSYLLVVIKLYNNKAWLWMGHKMVIFNTCLLKFDLIIGKTMDFKIIVTIMIIMPFINVF